MKLLAEDGETEIASGFDYKHPQEGEREYWFPAPSAPGSRYVALSQFRLTRAGKFRVKVKVKAEGFKPVEAMSEVVAVEGEDQGSASGTGEETSKADG